jgi:hypothetical protein
MRGRDRICHSSTTRIDTQLHEMALVSRLTRPVVYIKLNIYDKYER